LSPVALELPGGLRLLKEGKGPFKLSQR
jgi:hypothetical protein